ncbi:MAG: hypothetical protein WD068_02855 [Candidatus Babeliales bacterium]
MKRILLLFSILFAAQPQISTTPQWPKLAAIHTLKPWQKLLIGVVSAGIACTLGAAIACYDHSRRPRTTRTISSYDNYYEMERQCSWCHQKRWLPVRCDQCYAEFCEECITDQMKKDWHKTPSDCRKCGVLLSDALGYMDEHNIMFGRIS